MGKWLKGDKDELGHATPLGGISYHVVGTQTQHIGDTPSEGTRAQGKQWNVAWFIAMKVVANDSNKGWGFGSQMRGMLIGTAYSWAQHPFGSHMPN